MIAKWRYRENRCEHGFVNLGDNLCPECDPTVACSAYGNPLSPNAPGEARCDLAAADETRQNRQRARLAEQLSRPLARRLRSRGVEWETSLSGKEMLELIAERPGVDVIAIADHLHTTIASVNAMAERLRRFGCIVRLGRGRGFGIEDDGVELLEALRNPEPREERVVRVGMASTPFSNRSALHFKSPARMFARHRDDATSVVYELDRTFDAKKDEVADARLAVLASLELRRRGDHGVRFVGACITIEHHGRSLVARVVRDRMGAAVVLDKEQGNDC